MEIEFKIFPVRLRMYKPNNLFSQKVTTVLIQRKNCAMRTNDCAQYFPLCSIFSIVHLPPRNVTIKYLI